MPPGIFSTNPTTPTAFIFAFLIAKLWISPATTADPAMSYFISSINFAGFKEIPPVSKQTPFPTNDKGWFLFFLSPYHSKVTRNDSLALPLPTPSKEFMPKLFSLDSLYTVTFTPNFFNFNSLLTYSFGYKTFGGSETKSLAKFVPTSIAWNFLILDSVLLSFDTRFKVIYFFTFTDL